MVLQNIQFPGHDVHQAFPAVIVDIRSENIRFPIQEIIFVFKQKDQIHISLHKTTGGGKGEFAQSIREIGGDIRAMMFEKELSQDAGIKRFQRKVELHFINPILVFNGG